jgi:hypothetical protein
LIGYADDPGAASNVMGKLQARLPRPRGQSGLGRSSGTCQTLIRVPAELFFAAHRVELPNWKPDALIDKKIRPAFGSFRPLQWGRLNAREPVEDPADGERPQRVGVPSVDGATA